MNFTKVNYWIIISLRVFIKVKIWSDTLLRVVKSFENWLKMVYWSFHDVIFILILKLLFEVLDPLHSFLLILSYLVMKIMGNRFAFFVSTWTLTCFSVCILFNKSHDFLTFCLIQQRSRVFPFLITHIFKLLKFNGSFRKLKHQETDGRQKFLGSLSNFSQHFFISC